MILIEITSEMSKCKTLFFFFSTLEVRKQLKKKEHQDPNFNPLTYHDEIWKADAMSTKKCCKSLKILSNLEFWEADFEEQYVIL